MAPSNRRQCRTRALQTIEARYNPLHRRRRCCFRFGQRAPARLADGSGVRARQAARWITNGARAARHRRVLSRRDRADDRHRAGHSAGATVARSARTLEDASLMIDHTPATPHLTEEERHALAAGLPLGEHARGAEEHVRECAECAADTRALEATMTRVRAASLPPAPADEMWPAIRSRIEQRKTLPLPPPMPTARRARWRWA